MNGAMWVGGKSYALFFSCQNLMSTLPGQEQGLSNMPPQQPYLSGQQPMYQQVSLRPATLGATVLATSSCYVRLMP